MSKLTDLDLITAAAQVVEMIESSGEAQSSQVTVSNGIILGIKPVPPFVTRAALSKVNKPLIPIVRIEEKDREEANPNDPNYLSALEDYQAARLAIFADVLMLKGTEVKFVPEGRSHPDDNDWVEELAFVGIEVPESKPARYLSWIKFHVLETERDIAYLTAMLVRSSGVTESEVQRAIETFRSNT